MTDHNEAFIDTPPEGFNPWGTKTLASIQLCAKSSGVDLDQIAMLIACYALVSRGQIKASEDDVMEEFALMDDSVFDGAVSYINRVNQRAESAKVESEGSGK